MLIKEYFEAENIKFEREYVLNSLQNDSKSFRVADFYLPEYNVFVEFFGRWNLDKNKEKYRIKKRVYEQNRIPCVFIYPDNLGILNFIFKRRLKFELKKYNKRWGLFKLNLNLFIEKNYALELIVLGFLIFYTQDNLKLFLSLVFIWELYKDLKATFFT